MEKQTLKTDILTPPFLADLPTLDETQLSPMLLKTVKIPFNNPNYIYELKLDGFRCLAYCSTSTSLISRNGNSFNHKFPELLALHKQCKRPCILDGEIVLINKNGVPDFSQLQKRRALKNTTRIKNAATSSPAVYVVFDVLSIDDKSLTTTPLYIRKQILGRLIANNQFITKIKYTDTNGIALFNAAAEKDLEGIVAKKKTSLYHCGKRREEWVKIKVKRHAEYRKHNN